jgi:hypothetical protein
MEEIPSQTMPVQRLKVAVLQLDLTMLWARNQFRRNSDLWECHKEKLDGLFPKDDSEMKTVLRLKCATWNVRELGEKEKELDKTWNENNIKILVITEIKKKLQGTKKTENYTVIYREVNRYTRDQSRVTI